MGAEQNYLTTPEASAAYGVSGSYLIRLVKEGAIDGHMRGPIWFVSGASVAAWKANHKKRGGSLKGQPWSKKRQMKATSAQQAEAKSPAPPAVPTPPAPAVKTSAPAQGAEASAYQRAGDAHIQIGNLQPGQGEMGASARAGDMSASITLERFRSVNFPGGYKLEHSYDRANRSRHGAMGKRQEERGQALQTLLREKLTEAMLAAGWQPFSAKHEGKTVWHYRPGQQREAGQ